MPRSSSAFKLIAGSLFVSAVSLAAVLFTIDSLQAPLPEKAAEPGPADRAEDERILNALFGIVSAHAQQTGGAAPGGRHKLKLRSYLRKFTKLDRLLKKFGHARVVVKYKKKAPNIPPPGVGSRSWYWVWKQVGFPAAASPKALGKSKFVRKDVTSEELQELRKDPEIDFVFPDLPIPPALTKSGPLVRPDLVALASGPQRPERQTHAVVVLDTGVESDHPFLGNAILKDFEACFSTEQLRPPYTSEVLCPGGESRATGAGAGRSCDPTIKNCDHGTHVAGIISGWNGTVDGKKVHGVGPEVPIIPVQIYSKITAKDICESVGMKTPCVMSWISDQVAALDYAKDLNDRGIPIGAVNLSLSVGRLAAACDQSDYAKPIADSIKSLAAANIPVVVAAGNEAALTAVGFPGCIQGAVTVAASDGNGNLAISFPDGAGGTNYSSMVDMAAPGVNILSSVPGKAFKRMSGTSMAAPHVAALLAKVRASRTTTSVDDAVKIVAGFAMKEVSHPTAVNLKRPIARFSDRQFSESAAAGIPAGLITPASAARPLAPASAASPLAPASAAKPPAPASAVRPGSTLAGGALKRLLSKSNRLIVHFDSASTAEDHKRIVRLLEKRGFKVLETKSKTSRIGVVVTDKPIDSAMLESLRKEAGIKGLYRDIPIPLR